MRKLFFVIFALLFVLSSVSCSRELTDEEILEKAAQIQAKQEHINEEVVESTPEVTASITDNEPSTTETVSVEQPEEINDMKDKVLAGILSEKYNPFFGMVEFDKDWYVLDRVELSVDEKEGSKYALKYITNHNSLGLIQDLVEVFNIEKIDAQGVAMQVASGKPYVADIEIPSIDIISKLTVYVDGDDDIIKIETIGTGNSIEEFIDLNINKSIYTDPTTENIFQAYTIESKVCVVIASDGFMYSNVTYEISENFDQYSHYYISDEFITLVSKGTRVVPIIEKNDNEIAIDFSQNTLDCEVASYKADQTIVFKQGKQSLDYYFSEYTLPEFEEGSLTSFGLESDTDHPGTYFLHNGDIDITIKKLLLGADEDYVRVNWYNHDYGCMQIIYYPESREYLIKIESDDEQYSSTFIINKNGIIKSADPFDDLALSLNDLSAITGVGALQSSEMLKKDFDDFILERFNISADTLFEASVR